MKPISHFPKNNNAETGTIAPLPVESDVESVADEIPHTTAEPAKGKDEQKDTDMKDEEDEEEDEDEDTSVATGGSTKVRC